MYLRARLETTLLKKDGILSTDLKRYQIGCIAQPFMITIVPIININIIISIVIIVIIIIIKPI